MCVFSYMITHFEETSIFGMQQSLTVFVSIYARFYLFLVSSKITEIKVRENGAANFYLPAAEDCGPYSLSGPDKSVVLRVSPDADTTISRLYSNRSTATVLENGTIVFTLHYITWRDKGAFLTQSLTRNPDCLWHGTITILEDGKQSHAYA